MGKVADTNTTRKNMIGVSGAALILTVLPIVLSEVAELSATPLWAVEFIGGPFQILYLGLVFVTTVATAHASEFPEEERFFIVHRGKLVVSATTLLFVASSLLVNFPRIERRPTLEQRFEQLEKTVGKTAEPGATDNPDDAHRVREDH